MPALPRSLRSLHPGSPAGPTIDKSLFVAELPEARRFRVPRSNPAPKSLAWPLPAVFLLLGQLGLVEINCASPNVREWFRFLELIGSEYDFWYTATGH